MLRRADTGFDDRLVPKNAEKSGAAGDADSEDSFDIFNNDPEFKSLNITNLPLFNTNPRGILLIRINTLDLDISKFKGDDIPKLFFVFKTSKMTIRSSSVKGTPYFVMISY